MQNLSLDECTFSIILPAYHRHNYKKTSFLRFLIKILCNPCIYLAELSIHE